MSKQKYYKVIVLAHQLKGKVVAKHGDIVAESQLTTDPKNLKGFVEEVKGKELTEFLAAKTKADDKTKAAADKLAADREAAAKKKAEEEAAAKKKAEEEAAAKANKGGK